MMATLGIRLNDGTTAEWIDEPVAGGTSSEEYQWPEFLEIEEA